MAATTAILLVTLPPFSCCLTPIFRIQRQRRVLTVKKPTINATTPATIAITRNAASITTSDTLKMRRPSQRREFQIHSSHAMSLPLRAPIHVTPTVHAVVPLGPHAFFVAPFGCHFLVVTSLPYPFTPEISHRAMRVSFRRPRSARRLSHGRV